MQGELEHFIFKHAMKSLSQTLFIVGKYGLHFRTLRTIFKLYFTRCIEMTHYSLIIFYEAINILLFLELAYIFFLVILIYREKKELLLLSIDVNLVTKSHRNDF